MSHEKGFEGKRDGSSFRRPKQRPAVDKKRLSDPAVAATSKVIGLVIHHKEIIPYNLVLEKSHSILREGSKNRTGQIHLRL